MFRPQFDKMLIYFQLILVHLLSFKNVTSMLICWSFKRLTWRLRSTLRNIWKPNFSLHKMPMCKTCHCKFVNVNAQPWAQCLPCKFVFLHLPYLSCKYSFNTYNYMRKMLKNSITFTWHGGKCIYPIPLMTIHVHNPHWLVVSIS
jgi:hypothetical protein